jgi:hypothetical protein
MPIRNLRDGTLKIADAGGTGGANVVTVDLEDGGLSWSQKTPANIIKDRGVLDHARLADEEPVTLNFQLKFQSFSTHAATTPYDALTQTGGASAWVSDEPNSDVYAVILEFTIVDPAGGASEVVTFARVCDIQIDPSEGDEYNTMAVSARCVETAPSLS